MSGSLKMMTLTHANLNKEVDVVTITVFAYYYSDAQKCTLLISTGGQVLPVKESVEEVREKLCKKE